MENKELEKVIHEVEGLKIESTQILKNNIKNEIYEFRKTLPKEILTDDLDAKVEEEVNQKLKEFSQELDLKPKALYYSLKSEVELNEEISERELTTFAYDFLEKNTKNKFLKRIFRELKKEHGK